MNPRLDITVPTTVGTFQSAAKIAIIKSPSITSPFASTAKQRSASPSCAIPRSAPFAFTAAIKFSIWVDPQFSLMFQPVGLAEIAITSAPARW